MGWIPENVRGGCRAFGTEELLLLFLLLRFGKVEFLLHFGLLAKTLMEEGVSRGTE